MATRTTKSRAGKTAGRAKPSTRTKPTTRTKPISRAKPSARTKKSGRSTEALETALRAFIRGKSEEYLRDPNITSVGIGYKETGGVSTGKLSVQFTVRRKVKDSQVESELGSAVIPKSVVVNGVEVPTDVLERDYELSYELVELESKDIRKQRLDVLVPGISVSHPNGTAGTLGLIVYDNADGTPCMLSNWHVLHTPRGRLGDRVVQPGPYDDNRVDQNAAGTLVRSHLGLAGDCAIARIEQRGVKAEIHELGIVPTRVGKPQLGDRVVKSGRTTGVTYGLVSRIDVTSKIDYGPPIGEQCIGGFEIAPDPDHPAPEGEISRPGDSGSEWLSVDKKGKPGDIVLGLHFAGESQENPKEYALAAYAHAVLEKLEVSLTPPGEATLQAREATARGYDPDFLGAGAPLPTLGATIARDAVSVNRSHVFHYTHFSLAMSKDRRMARYVAWNVDGARLRKNGRSGLKFRLDGRVPEEFQVGEEAYSGNKLDRGHIARRADLVWGSPTEAEQANRDSFYFTNITPQHQAFNQSNRHGLWGELENALYDEVEVSRLRLTVFGGPIFKDGDMEYRDILIPSDFWKVLVYVDEADGQMKAKAYILTQDNLLDDIEAFDLDPFRLYQVGIAELERKTGLKFGAVARVDDFAAGRVPESLSATGNRRRVREITDRSELIRPQ